MNGNACGRGASVDGVAPGWQLSSALLFPQRPTSAAANLSVAALRASTSAAALQRVTMGGTAFPSRQEPSRLVVLRHHHGVAGGASAKHGANAKPPSFSSSAATLTSQKLA